jgi:hypothetical protein
MPTKVDSACLISYCAMGMAQGVEAHVVRVVSGNSGEEIVDLAGCRAALRLLDHVPLRSRKYASFSK